MQHKDFCQKNGGLFCPYCESMDTLPVDEYRGGFSGQIRKVFFCAQCGQAYTLVYRLRDVLPAVPLSIVVEWGKNDRQAVRAQIIGGRIIDHEKKIPAPLKYIVECHRREDLTQGVNHARFGLITWRFEEK